MTSSMVGIEGAAPGRVTAIAAALEAVSRACSTLCPPAMAATK